MRDDIFRTIRYIMSVHCALNVKLIMNGAPFILGRFKNGRNGAITWLE